MQTFINAKGGDGQDTFNVSTAASIVCAGAGLIIAKHGNRSASSKCGSADVIEALGCTLASITPLNLPSFLSSYAFLFAQTFHPTMKIFGPARKALGRKSIFNHVGPLTNPARPKRMVVGVYEEAMGEVMAGALIASGVESGIVVCGHQGLDEVYHTL
jgi:anthranilate phosphoribosyltransferase